MRPRAMNATVDSFLADLPTRHREAWKYTDLKAVAAVAEAAGWTEAPEETLSRHPDAPALPGIEADTLLIVDGRPEPSDRIEVSRAGFRLKPGAERPLHLAFVSTATDGEAFAAAPSLTLTADAGQRLSLIESHRSLGAGNALTKIGRAHV